MAVTANINGDITVNGVYVGNFITSPALKSMSESQLLEQGSPGYNAPAVAYASEEDDYNPIGLGPEPILGGPGAQDSGSGFAEDPWVPHDPNPDWHPEPHGDIDSPEFGQPGFYDAGDWFSQAAAERPDYYNPTLNPGLNQDEPFAYAPQTDWDFDQTSTGGLPMAEGYAPTGAQPSMCKLALMNKALIAIVQAGAVTSAGNPLLGVVGSILANGLKRLGVGPDWGRRIFGGSQDADVCQRIVEEAIAVGYLRIPKPNANGSLPANMQITLDPDSPRATLQWRRKSSTSTRRAPTRTARRTTYRRRRA